MSYDLKGTGVPHSPSGNSGYRMVAQEYSGRACYVLFRPSEGVLERYVPPPLQLTSDYAFVKFYELKRRNVGEDYAEPAFSHYNEAVIACLAEYEGEIGHYNFAMWVSRDWAHWKAREVLGWPKKLADVAITTDTALDDFGGGDDDFHPDLQVVVNRHGHEIARGRFTFDGQGSTSDLPKGGLYWGVRHLPNPAESEKTIRQLVRMETQDSRLGPILTGAGELDFFDCPDEELSVLQPSEVIRALYFPIKWILPAYPGRIVHDMSGQPAEGGTA